MAKQSTEIARKDDVQSVALSKLNSAEFAKEMVSRGFGTEQYYKMQEGDKLLGIYLGPGADAEMRPDENGEIKFLKTWRINPIDIETRKSFGITVRLQGSHELNQFFSELPAGTVFGLENAGKVQIGLRQVTKYNKFVDEGSRAKAIAERGQAANA